MATRRVRSASAYYPCAQRKRHDCVGAYLNGEPPCYGSKHQAPKRLWFMATATVLSGADTSVASSPTRAPTLLRRLRIASIVLLFFTWEGLPGLLLGQDVQLHHMAISVLILGFAALRIGQAMMAGRIAKYELFSIGLFSLCIVVTFVSNTWIFPQDRWLGTTLSVAPILLILTFRLFNFKGEEILAALLWAGVLASFIVVADQLLRFSFMDAFARGVSAGIERRVVFLKTESAFALVILAARLLTAKKLKELRNYGLFAAVVVTNLVVVTESRLAIAAVAISVLTTVMFSLPGRQKLRAILALVMGVAVLGQAIFGKYVEQFLATQDYLTDDVSVNWRSRTVEYFYQYFDQTNGLGFGLMSTNPDASNFMSWAMNYAGIYAGIGKYPMGVADIGIIAALVQFGYIGLLVVVAMTLAMSWRLMKAGYRQSHEIFAMGALVLGYMLSPLPMNFFTLEWTAISGNVVWAIAAFAPAIVAVQGAGGKVGVRADAAL